MSIDKFGRLRLPRRAINPPEATNHNWHDRHLKICCVGRYNLIYWIRRIKLAKLYQPYSRSHMSYRRRHLRGVNSRVGTMCPPYAGTSKARCSGSRYIHSPNSSSNESSVRPPIAVRRKAVQWLPAATSMRLT
jgi:hypothetical protein